MTNTFKSPKKFNAVRAVTSALRKVHGPEFDPKSGVDYSLAQVDGIWIAAIIDKTAAPAAAPAKPADIAPQATAQPIQATAAPATTDVPARLSTSPAKGGKKAAAIEAAARGELPQAPDFSASTHAAFRKRLDAIKAMVDAGDVAGLQADKTEPKSSSRVMLCRYRDLAITALQARAAGKVCDDAI